MKRDTLDAANQGVALRTVWRLADVLIPVTAGSDRSSTNEPLSPMVGPTIMKNKAVWRDEQH